MWAFTYIPILPKLKIMKPDDAFYGQNAWERAELAMPQWSED